MAFSPHLTRERNSRLNVSLFPSKRAQFAGPLSKKYCFSRFRCLLFRLSCRFVQVFTFIDIEDSEAVLRAIRLTPDDQPIDLILHTPGGLVLAAEEIAKALARA
jgi:Serine dehydrogenase proteinase